MKLLPLRPGFAALLSLLAAAGPAAPQPTHAYATGAAVIAGDLRRMNDGHVVLAATASPNPMPPSGSGLSSGTGATSTPSPMPTPTVEGASRNVDMPPTARFGRNCTTGPGGIRYCASSVLEPMGKNSYETSMLYDKRGDTAWVEGEAGDGIGVELMLDFGSTRQLAGLDISNGYDKDDRIWSRNSRVAGYELGFDDGTTAKGTLADRRGMTRVTFDPPVTTRWLTLTIRSVHRGTKYTDTAVSELHPIVVD